MVEKSDARFEWLEKTHQDTQEKMTEMMEILWSLMREKGLAVSPGLQSDAAQLDQRRDEPTYPPGFTPPYAQTLSIPQM